MLETRLSAVMGAMDTGVGPAVRKGAAPAVWLARLLGLIYLAGAMLVMWRAPRVPYADGWRFLGHFADTDFPRDILMPDNGHFEVLPNMVRVIELHLLDADQSLQVVVGILLLLSCLVAGWRWIRTADSPEGRAGALLILVVGFCWLGNSRALAHGNESVHAYAVVLFLFSGIACLARQDAPASVKDVCLAGICGLCAAVSFGSGIAVFIAFLVVAVVRREPARNIGALLLFAASAYLILRSAGAGASPEPDPVRQLDLAMRWLSAPWMHAAGPAIDPSTAARMSSPAARSLFLPMAGGWEAAMGPASLARWPYVVVSAVGIATLAAATWRCIRGGTDSRPRMLGLAMAWFALSVALMVAVVRTPYFQAHPDQLMAPRYVVWSSLFWAGLGIVLVAGVRAPMRALLAAIVAAALLLPSQYWTSRLAGDIRVVAAQTATAAAVGVLEPDLLTGETVPRELAAALPPLKKMGASVFSWPETRMQGEAAPEMARYLEVRGISVEPVGNVLGAPGRRVSFQLADPDAERLLLVDADGVVRGLAARDGTRGGHAWLGWMTARLPVGSVRVAALPLRPQEK